MTPRPRRGRREVRACQRCRDLKVGCDKQKPACQRCIKAGARCRAAQATKENHNAPNIMLVSNETINGDVLPNIEGVDSRGSPTEKRENPSGRRCEDFTDAPKQRTNSSEFNTLSISEKDGLSSFTELSSLLSSFNCSHCAQQKRNRCPASCIRCRQLKVRCNRERPCYRCTRAKAECIYNRISGQPYNPSLPKDSKYSSYATRCAVWRGKFRTDTHWVNLVREVEESLSHRHSAPTDCENERLSQKADDITNYPFVTQSIKSRGALMECLPPRALVETFIRLYIDTFEKTHCILHIPTFEAEMVRFWKQPDDVEDSWLAMLFIILYLGCQADYTTPESFPDFHSGLMLAQLLDASQGFLYRVPFMAHPNLDIIRTLCLMVIAKQTGEMSCYAMSTSWCLIGLIVRLSIGMGLHSESLPNENPQSLEIELRGILWTTITYLDLRQSVLMGMPLLLRPQDYARPFLANIIHKDVERLSYQAPKPSEQRNKTESTFHSLFALAFPLACKLVDFSHNKDLTDNYDLAVRYTCEVQELLREATGLLRRSRAASDTANSFYPESLQAIMLDVLFRRLLLSIHKRFASDYFASVQYPVSYWTSLDCAVAILVHQRDLWEASKNHSAVSKSFTCLFWPDFLSAALTLSLYLLRGDSLLDPPIDRGYCGIHARSTLQDALRSCADIWRLERDKNICHSQASRLIDRVVSTLAYMDGEPGTSSSLT